VSAEEVLNELVNKKRNLDLIQNLKKILKIELIKIFKK